MRIRHNRSLSHMTRILRDAHLHDGIIDYTQHVAGSGTSRTAAPGAQ